MLNIEKYKDEIKVELEKDNTLGCVVNKLMGNKCDYYPKCNDCYLKVLDWLLQEYKEPILTDEEKVRQELSVLKNTVAYLDRQVILRNITREQYQQEMAVVEFKVKELEKELLHGYAKE